MAVLLGHQHVGRYLETGNADKPTGTGQHHALFRAVGLERLRVLVDAQVDRLLIFSDGTACARRNVENQVTRLVRKLSRCHCVQSLLWLVPCYLTEGRESERETNLARPGPSLYATRPFVYST